VDFTASLKDFLAIPGAKLLRGPASNPVRGVQFALVEQSGMGTVEVLSPLNGSTPVSKELELSVGACYFCYAVRDIDEAVKIAKKRFSVEEVEALYIDPAYDDRRVVTLRHAQHGVFKLVEAYPNGLLPLDSLAFSQKSDALSQQRHKLMGIFRSVIKDTDVNYDEVTMDSFPEWDSFTHLVFIMEVEKLFEISIPASDFGQLNSLAKLDNYLTNK
jgi:acyl carrier protein